MFTKMMSFVAVAGLVLALATPAMALDIPVLNASFEEIANGVEYNGEWYYRGVDVFDLRDGSLDGHLMNQDQPTMNDGPRNWVTTENAGDAIAWDARWPSWWHSTNAGPADGNQVVLLDNRGFGRYGQILQDLGTLSSLGITGPVDMVMTFQARFGQPNGGSMNQASDDVELHAFFEVSGTRDTDNQFVSPMGPDHVDNGGTRLVHSWADLGLTSAEWPPGPKSATPEIQLAGSVAAADDQTMHMGTYTVTLPVTAAMVTADDMITIGFRYEDNRSDGGCCGARSMLDNVSVEAISGDPDLPGDANDSGFVDDDDLAVLLSNWEQDAGTITTWALGDFTGDTDVDDDDLAVLLGNWTGPPPGGAAVPEPATMALLGLGGLSVLRRRRS